MVTPNDNNELLKHIRDASKDAHECANRYAFHVLTVAAAVFFLILRFFRDEPVVGLAGIFVVALVLLSVRVAMWKYQDANRLLGYELFLHRTKALPDHPPDGWLSNMRNIGFEEAIGAWRIVHPLFLTHHRSGDESVLGQRESTTSFSGGYLRIIILFQFLAAAVATVPIFMVAVTAYTDGGSSLIAGGFLLVAIVVTIGLVISMISANCTRRQLENGVLSVNSCSLIWMAVAIAHYRVLNNASDDAIPFGPEYFSSLRAQAEDLVRTGADIATWIISTSDGESICEQKNQID